MPLVSAEKPLSRLPIDAPFFHNRGQPHQQPFALLRNRFVCDIQPPGIERAVNIECAVSVLTDPGSYLRFSIHRASSSALPALADVRSSVFFFFFFCFFYECWALFARCTYFFDIRRNKLRCASIVKFELPAENLGRGNVVKPFRTRPTESL